MTERAAFTPKAVVTATFTPNTPFKANIQLKKWSLELLRYKGCIQGVDLVPSGCQRVAPAVVVDLDDCVHARVTLP